MSSRKLCGRCEMLCRLTIKGDVIEVSQQARETQFRDWLRDLDAYRPGAHQEIKCYIHAYLDSHNSATARDIAVVSPGRWYPTPPAEVRVDSKLSTAR